MINLSVIVPVTGGRLNNLRNTLHALTLQTLPADRFELIVVNDGSTDDFPALLEMYNGLDIRYLQTPKFIPGLDIPPRNKGARLARYKHLVFLDSDVILDKRALEFFAEDFDKIPNRVVAGIYDWLPPCRIGLREIDAGLDSIYHVDGDDLGMKLPLLPWPKGVQTHNVCRDMRRPMFYESPVDEVYTGPGNVNCYLGAFSGCIGYAAPTFWGSGGFWEDLTAGLVDDGALGLTLWAKSVKRDKQGNIVYGRVIGHPTILPEYGISFDQRIQGAHQYHDRNVQWVQVQSAREVDLINRRFGLEQYADGRTPIIPKPVYALTDEAHEAWGVNKWNKLWETRE